MLSWRFSSTSLLCGAVLLIPPMNDRHSESEMPHSIQACYNLDQVFEGADPKITATAVNGEATVIKDKFIDEVTPQGIFVNYSKLTEVEDDASWEFLLKTLSQVEKKKVLQFLKKDDQKRSLLSILLQRSTIRRSFQINNGQYEIRRTKENKPYAFSPTKEIGIWNYNVSHHGEYVCIVSHPKLIVGIDVVDKRTRSPFAKSVHEFVNMFKSQFTAIEMHNILREDSDDLRYQHFFIIWSLKEAFSKAVGVGLGYDLTLVNFSIKFMDAHSNSLGRVGGTATMNIERRLRNDWKFKFFSLDDNHIVSIALGPTSDVASDYRNSAWAAPKNDLKTNIWGSNSQSHDHIEEIDATSSHYNKILQFRLPDIEYAKISDMLCYNDIAAWTKFLKEKECHDVDVNVSTIESSPATATCVDDICSGCTGT